MNEFCAASGRVTYVVNLDPAADHFDYPVAFGTRCIVTVEWEIVRVANGVWLGVDIRDLISVEDVMEELGYGPNGGLVYCMECVVLLAAVLD